jgi:TPR repeat protein
MSSVRGQRQEQGQPGGRRRRIAEVLGAQIEPITRFKASDLKELAQDTDSSAELVVTTRQRVDLDIETSRRSGRLPPGIAQRLDVGALDVELQQRLATAESGATAMIQRWVTEEPGRYRRLLPAGALFDCDLNEPIGTEWGCITCAQLGRITCSACAGSGAQTCQDCAGRRRCACHDCRGLGRLACAACDGRGLVKASPAAAAVDPASAPVASETLVPCAACSQGWLNCTTCDGQGEQDCPRCTASGSIVCPECQGRQTRDCPDCQATGWQHQWGRLRERLEIEDLLELHTPDPGTADAIADAIAERFADVTTLDAVCTLEQVRYTTAPLAVQAVQRLKLPVRQARLQVAGQAMQFMALGPALDIVDHQGIAAVLLAHDLGTLEKNTAGTGRHLGEALQRFLQSPLNREIAARTPPLDIERMHPGMVDEAYQTRALQSAQRAIERLWLQRVWRPRLFCLVGIGLVAALALVLGSPRVGLVSAAAVAVGSGLVAWLIADWRARQGLARALQVPQGDRLLRPLRQSTVVRHWQLKSLAAAVLVALASAGAMTRLPQVRQHTERAQAAAALGQRLDAWLVSEGKDFRLRHYPAADLLAQAAEPPQADPRARLVRAWQLLLGTDGVTADPRAAERLLDGLSREPGLASAAVIAQARATLALNSRSASPLQTAAAALDALPDPQLPEALYTLALLQLTPALAARLGGPQQGLTTLQQAADLGHASACFELGRRLASGTGLRRDLAGARRYLGYAEAKGVPGAAQAAAAIR